MELRFFPSLLLCSLTLCSLTLSQLSITEPSRDQYDLYQSLETALLCDPYSLYVLAETFFPKIGDAPICIPINYSVTVCNQTCNASSCCYPCAANTTSNFTFLWTRYDINNSIGSLLLSYISNGIIVKGFDNWDYKCFFKGGITLNLIVGDEDVNTTLLDQTLPGLTAVLKGYAVKEIKRELVDSSDVQGYAVRWNEEDQENRVFKNSNVILTTMVAILDIFILLLAMGMTTYSYDNVYKNVKGKKNPGYPLFWSVVVLCICWDVAPSWIVLEDYNHQVTASLIVLTILLLLIAILFKKKSDFPVPFFEVCKKHNTYRYSFDFRSQCFRCFISHFGQIVAIWSILVFFAFVFFYIPAVIISFYLDPIQTLVKVILLKAIAVCAVLTVALVFSLSRFRFSCHYRVWKHNLTTTIAVLTVIFFLPILGFLAFVIGGIVFVQNSTISGLQGIITLIPSLFLFVIAWLSHKKLFPKELDEENDPAEKIIDNLEGSDSNTKSANATTHYTAAKRHNTSGLTARTTAKPVSVQTAATVHSRSVSSSPRSERMSNYSSIGSGAVTPPTPAVITQGKADFSQPLLHT